MAKRPIFIPVNEPPFVEERSIEFQWHPGLSLAQKRRSIEALHEAAGHYGIAPVLEVSSRSPDRIGTELSAFNLILPAMRETPRMSVECAYQGSKVFEGGGPYVDLFDATPVEAKRDPRLQTAGELVKFSFRGEDWPLEPRNAFYDRLYIEALLSRPDLASSLGRYAAFTDIEFNPEKSVNCQARAVALFVALDRTKRLDAALASQQAFLDALGQARHGSSLPKADRQGRLF